MGLLSEIGLLGAKAAAKAAPEGLRALSPPTRQQAEALASGLSLAGRLLAPPRFHATGWHWGQMFTEDDDPDRMAEPFEPPMFLSAKDPLRQRARTAVEELPVPGKLARGSFARVVRGAIDEEDCAELLAAANAKGFTPALLNIGGKQALDPVARDGHRAIFDCPELTAWLFKVVEPHLPPELYGDGLLDLNERCRVLCYTPGQEFGSHCDGSYRRPGCHPDAGARSRVTLQLYLHDVPKENGGATTFHFDPWSDKEDVPHQPRAGDVLLFTQNLLHSGSLLTAGVKYTVRTEAMYGVRKRPHHGTPVGPAEPRVDLLAE
eukprot:CAMPEP_0195080778 /NCGR_PEP_ID=MMETSP0448-20130528/22410_1 /TAXON_ID=66468 /ORGANISM="Heterocapsa triquestra, Strain CCMP 448" /LENGTH=319 /DNA_ID=CAMNT_0040113757 /DNA_START=1 /DNA_END=958 /DNA_ORIENTATION=-